MRSQGEVSSWAAQSERIEPVSDTTNHAELITSIGDTDVTLADPAADVRGRNLEDQDGNKIGTIDDLLIDTETRQVRFLRVEHGGFLGIGEKHFLVPVDAIAAVDSEDVRIDRPSSKMKTAPGYDPNAALDNNFYVGLYNWWEYRPFWADDYVYPPFPMYPARPA